MLATIIGVLAASRAAVVRQGGSEYGSASDLPTSGRGPARRNKKRAALIASRSARQR